jgi:DNA-binding MarR family transcriptional regulator
MPLHPNDSPGFLLWRTTLRWQREIAAALRPIDLTHVQFVLLACTWWLNSQDRRPSQVELATFAETDIKMTSTVIRDLERAGLLDRERDPDDARAFRLRVTRAGGRLAPRAIDVVEDADRRFFEGVPTRDLLRLLDRLARSPAPA